MLFRSSSAPLAYQACTPRSKARRPYPPARTPFQHYQYNILSRINVLLTALHAQRPLPARIPLSDLGPGFFIHATQNQYDHVFDNLLAPHILANVEKQAQHEQDPHLVSDFIKCLPYEIIVALFANTLLLKKAPSLQQRLLALYPHLVFFEDTLPATSPDQDHLPIISVRYNVDHVCDY